MKISRSFHTPCIIKGMNFIHIADLHCNKERKEFCLKALSKIKEFIKNTPAVILIAGDFWDSTITATENSGFINFVKAVKELCELTDVIIITGTPSHEPAGSCDIFETFGARVYRQNTFLSIDSRYGAFELAAMPEPRKQDFINSLDIDKAIQQSYKDFINQVPTKNKLPRIAVIHNEIRSALLQNSVVIDESHPAAIPASLLKKINADYYACGHIHEPQRISSVGECYYSGSVYPRNFGETHNGGFYFVSIENNDVKVRRELFGFPQNITERCEISEIEKYKGKDFLNKNVKFIIHLDKLFRKDFSKDKLEKKLQDYTKATSVSVQFEYTENASLRSKEISEKTDIIEKFRSYAKLTSIKYSNSLINKLQIIKENLENVSFVPNDTYELRYLSLRGAIGLKDGIGLDEIEIDFSKYNSGVLCLLGKNGSGKSTLIENAHPYPQMLTRPGSLKEHFFLKDSHRILIYRTSKGKEIKITMQIDGVAKAVGTRYFVEEKESCSTWKPIASVDGSNESYMNYVLSHFGDVSLFLRTAFYAKKQIKSIPDLSIATKGEKIELFSILAGTDYLSEISESAKQSKKDIKKKIDDIKSRLSNFDDIKKRTTEYKENIEAKYNELQNEKANLDIDKKELEIYKEEQDKYDKAVVSITFLHKSITEKTAELDNIRRDMLLYKSNIEELQNQLENEDLYREQLKWFEENTKKRKQLVSLKMNLALEKTDIESNILKKEEEERSIQVDILKLKNEITTLNFSLDSAEKAIIKNSEVCPVCGQPLDKHKKDELEAEQKKLKGDIKNIKSLLQEFSKKQEEMQKSIEQLGIKELKLSLKNKNLEISDIENDISQIDSYMDSIDIAEIKNTLENALPLLNDNKRRFGYEKDKYEKTETELKELSEKSKNLPTDYSDKIKRLERGIENTKENIATLSTEIKVLQDSLKSFKKYEEQISEIDTQLKNYNKDLKEFDIIENSFGNTGIQSYELDNVAPEIADITNRILKETCGDRFSVSFCTQRDSSDGKKIDDFIINVFDSNSGREKKLNLLSSGESVWIKQALYFAFSVIRTKNTGFCFKTRFLDESDGELDSESRPRFVKMIETAHKMCNATLTILITHSVEVKDLIGQKIELKAGRELL